MYIYYIYTYILYVRVQIGIRYSSQLCWYRLEFETLLAQIEIPNCPKVQIGIFLPFCGFQSISGQFGILCSLRGEGSPNPMIDSEASFPLRIPFCPGTD